MGTRGYMAQDLPVTVYSDGLQTRSESFQYHSLIGGLITLMNSS